jgi:hypothetical protein
MIRYALILKKSLRVITPPPYLYFLYSLQAIEKSGVVEQGGGWFSSVSRFLSESFYW